MIEELKARIAELEQKLYDSLDAERDANMRIADLERQLAESRDFAISEAAKIRAEYERQQALLVEALRLGTSVLHEYPGGEICLCSQCEFVRARAKALAAVKSAGNEPSARSLTSLLSEARDLFRESVEPTANQQAADIGMCAKWDVDVLAWLRNADEALAAVKSSKYVPPKPNHQVQSLIEAARCLGVAQAKGDHTQHWESAVADLSAALNAAVKPAGQKGGDRG